MSTKKEKAHYSQGVLVFNITHQQCFAIGTLKIREIVPYKTLFQLPKSHGAVKGAMHMRGHTIAVIDMASAIGYQPIPEDEIKNCVIIVTDCQRKIVGFLVRGIERITEYNWRETKAAPKALGNQALVSGMCQLGDEVLQMIDLEYILLKVFPDSPDSTHAILTDIQREQLKPLNILLVDDSVVARKQLTDALLNLNIPFQVTENGREALNIMANAAKDGKPIDLLVSDIEMPGLDGYELTFEIRNQPQLASCYIILHSSLSSHISVSQANQVGANEALTKFDVHDLIGGMLRGAEHKEERSNQAAQ